MLGPLGVNKAQGALPLGRRALSILLAPPLPWVTTPRPLLPLEPLLAFFLPPSLLGPLGVNKAQGALPLGHRVLVPPPCEPHLWPRFGLPPC